MTARSWILASLALLLCVAAPDAAAQQGPLPARLEVLAAQGDGEALYHLGMLHHLGLEGVERDPRRALELFRRSAEAGDPLGAYKLGCFYAGQGEGVVADDPELALRYKRVAAEAGYDLAQAEIARIYHDRGDADQALHWLEAAARQGNASAVEGALFYRSPLGPRPDPAQAWLYYELMRRHLEAMIDRLGRMPQNADAERPSLDEVTAPLRELLADSSEADRARAARLLEQWREQRSPVSLKADSGLGAAYRRAGLPAPEISEPQSPNG